MHRLLIQGGCVLTLGARSPNFAQGDLLIEDDVIAEVGVGLRARDAEVIDARDMIVMPGFVDTHRHVGMALFRNLGSVASQIDSGDFAPDDRYAATLIGLLRAAAAGITSVVDWADLPDDPSHTEAALQAHHDAGLRTVLVSSGSLPHRPGSLMTQAFASPDLTRANLDRLEATWVAARANGHRIHAHAGLTHDDAGIVADLGVRRLLASDVTLVHCTHLSDGDLDAVAAAGVSVSLAPSSEMAGGLGAPPLQKFLDRKIQPGIAVDDERLAPGDMFAQMRVTNSLQHASYFDLKLAGKAGLPNLLTTRDIIRFATLEGAQTIGQSASTGSLEPGKQADVLMLRTDRPNIFPVNDPIGAVVWGVDSSNVDWVFVAGRPLVRNGEPVADVSAVRALAETARDRVGLTSGIGITTGARATM